jgi:hypothetical protein
MNGGMKRGKRRKKDGGAQLFVFRCAIQVSTAPECAHTHITPKGKQHGAQVSRLQKKGKQIIIIIGF